MLTKSTSDKVLSISEKLKAPKTEKAKYNMHLAKQKQFANHVYKEKPKLSKEEVHIIRSNATSGEKNGMYGKGELVSGGNNGHANIRYFYKNEVFECRKDLINYLTSIGLYITNSALRILVKNKATDRLYSMYSNILKDLSWEYK